MSGAIRRSLDRWGAVLRYHHPRQLARRVWNRLRDKLPLGEASVDGPTPNVREVFSRDAQQSAPLRVAAKQEFDSIRLLNRAFALGWPPQWDDADGVGMPLLAVFHLHDHEWLLKIAENEPHEAWSAIQSWIDRFPALDRTPAGWAAWHPYCISLRTFVWLKLFASAPPTAVRTAMIDHLAKQARRLACRFERDIGGNHLWENARALAALGAFFDDDEADAWRRHGLSTLWQCLRDQLSPEGEHFERSPMYQAELAHGLGELADVLQFVEPEATERCRATSARMTDFLDALRHPDGGLPLLGDTTLDDVGPGEPEASGTGVASIDHRAPLDSRPQTPVADAPGSPNPFIPHPSFLIPSHHGDYFIHRSERGFLLFDAGDIGPDHLPAHAHADLLGFEASAFGKRLFVDSGVFCYQGPRREEFRKSAAHNVLTVDGVELADVWGSFRIGRRGHVVSRRAGAENGVHWICAEHDAYRRMGIRVQRWWIIPKGGGVWISVHVVLGRGRRTLTEYVHLHPEVVWTRIERTVTLQVGSGVVRWVPASLLDVRTETTAHSERFFEERPKTTLILERETELPAASAWAVALGGGDLKAAAAIEGNRLVVRWTLDGAEQTIERSLEHV